MGGKQSKYSPWVIPKDVTTFIFTFLSAQDVYQCSNVCKIWRQWIAEANLEMISFSKSGPSRGFATANASYRVRTLLIGQSKQFYSGSSGRLSELGSKFVFRDSYQDPPIPMTICVPDERQVQVNNHQSLHLYITENETKSPYSFNRIRLDDYEAFVFYYSPYDDQEPLLLIERSLKELQDIRERGRIKTIVNTTDTSKKRYGRYRYSEGPPNIVYTCTTIKHTPPFSATPKLLVEILNGEDSQLAKSVSTKQAKEFAKKYHCHFMTVDLRSFEQIDACFLELGRICINTCMFPYSFVDPSKAQKT